MWESSASLLKDTASIVWYSTLQRVHEPTPSKVLLPLFSYSDISLSKCMFPNCEWCSSRAIQNRLHVFVI